MTSRNRPRSSFAKDDSGEAELQNLWGTIVDKIKRCESLRSKYDEIEARRTAIEDEMKADTLTTRETAAKLEEIEKLYREALRLSEEETSILNEEPDDLIRNLDTLVQVKTALQDSDVPKPVINTKSRGVKRGKLDVDGASDSPVLTPDTATPSQSIPRALKGNSRSGSVTAQSVKSENSGDGPENIKPVMIGKEGKLVTGAYVLHRKKGSDGVGILCRVSKIIGDGKQRRYEVQDVDSEDSPLERVSLQNLIPVPDPKESLPEISKGSQVVAVYPDTTTFYKAEVVGLKKDGLKYRLKFEGEEEMNKEQEVIRHLVLDKS